MTERREGAGRTALITRASAGIGAALARVFAARGFDLVVTARRRDRLIALAREIEAAHDVHVRAMSADLAQPNAPSELLQALAGEGITLDVLVNNAGYGLAGTYRQTSWDEQRDFLQVLVVAPCELAHRLLPGMIQRHYGRILNVASVAGLMPGSGSHTLYGGAKALMIKFSQSLHTEQSGSGVHVTALCPGFTLTEFHDVNGTRTAMGRMPRLMWLTAERVAREGYEAVMKNQPLSIPGVPYKAIVALVKWLPLRTAHRLGAVRARILERHKQA
jgi:short-subunit dehydrogenase